MSLRGSDVNLFAVVDGHGEAGKDVSAFVVGALSNILTRVLQRSARPCAPRATPLRSAPPPHYALNLPRPVRAQGRRERSRAADRGRVRGGGLRRGRPVPRPRQRQRRHRHRRPPQAPPPPLPQPPMHPPRARRRAAAGSGA